MSGISGRRKGYVRPHPARHGHALGGSLLLEQAAVALRRIAELGESHFEYPFYQGKVQAARFYVRNIVPEINKIAAVIKDGDTSALEIMEEGL
ncbi:MAG: acyl-CoA dehydrogenase C-terminal domain-containing protein [Desulfurispora sp.]|uniref:acyl-CoA dehydrogenase C-terminal domain-containing protein n=1 Tax=Desulfurispora sp. TaxID=3014275 RepID=UPI00404B8173